MSNKHLRSKQIPPLTIQHYERYLPTAFDESMSLLEKVNRVILYLHEYGDITNQMLEKWNEVYEWINNEGLEELVTYRLNEWLENGTIEDLINQNILSDLKDKIEEIEKIISDTLVNTEITLTVGSNGRFKEVSDAIDYISNRIIKPKKVEIKLLSGYVMERQVIMRNAYLSFVTITSEDEAVRVKPNHLDECIRINTPPSMEVVPLFYGKNSRMPTIDVKFQFISADITSDQCVDCNNIVSGLLADNSTVLITGNGGFTHFPFLGVCGVNTARVVANHADFSHTGNRDKLNKDNFGDSYGNGVRMWNSTFSGAGSKANRCGAHGYNISMSSSANLNGAEANHCGHHGLLVTTGSTCSARGAEFSDTLDDNVVAYASSHIDFRNGVANRAVVNYGVIATRASTILFQNGEVRNCGKSGIMANRGSTIDATNATAHHNFTNGVQASNNSKVDFTGGYCGYNEKDGLHSTHGSVIQARNARVTNNTRKGALAYISSIYAHGATISNNHRNLEATRGGDIHAHKAVLSYAEDFSVLAYGGTIYCAEANVYYNGNTALHATRGGTIIADRVKIHDTGGRGVFAYSGKIHINFATISKTKDRPVEATGGGEIVARGVKASGGGAYAFSVYYGGRIFAPESTGSTNRTPNQFNQHGIIVK